MARLWVAAAAAAVGQPANPGWVSAFLIAYLQHAYVCLYISLLYTIHAPAEACWTMLNVFMAPVNMFVAIY